ncbi:MAG: hypothetical protein HOW73_27135 [Polyangiaceae bacterium]|nr:hypothetical protein [Polyangiaceae bacterium]
MRTNGIFILLLSISSLVVVGCDDDSSTDGGAGGDGGGVESGGAGLGGGDQGGGGEGGGGAGGSGGAGPVSASWDIDSNMNINGLSAEEAIASAVSRHQVFDGDDYLSVILTDVASFCEALQAGDCGTETHFRIEIDLVGLEPGTHEIGDGVVSAWTGDVPQSCAGAGLGAESGTVTFTTIDLGDGAVVEVDFDLQFLTGYATGTAVAPLCVVEGP